MTHLQKITNSYADSITKKELNADIHVEDDWENESSQTLKGWYAVSTSKLSIIAYFGDEIEAYRYKKSLVKSILKFKKQILKN